MRSTRSAALPVFAIALGMAATSTVTCAPVPLGDGKKRIAVREIATTVILPTLDDLVTATTSLRDTSATLAAEPTVETLTAARDAWRSARLPWKEAGTFGFGPAADLRLGVAIDQRPVDRANVEGVVAGAGALDADAIESLGANRKGFHAIEHLLFAGDSAGDDSTDDDGADDDTADNDIASVLASLTTDPLAERRRAFLVGLSENLDRKANELRAAWAADGGNYVAVMLAPGGANAAYKTIKSVIDTLVSQSVTVAETVADSDLGKPMGKASGGTPDPGLQESGPSDNSIADMAASLRSIRNAYLGTRTGVAGGGLTTLVVEQRPATDAAVRRAIDDALAAVDAIPRPYATALSEGRPELATAYDATKALKRILATEVIAVLGATLKFGENDGD